MYRHQYHRYPVHPSVQQQIYYDRPYYPIPPATLNPRWMYQNPGVAPQNYQQTVPFRPNGMLSPQPALMQDTTQGQTPSWTEIFKTEKGQVDVNKVMSTAGQVMTTAQQFGSLVKGIGSIFTKV